MNLRLILKLHSSFVVQGNQDRILAAIAQYSISCKKRTGLGDDSALITWAFGRLGARVLTELVVFLTSKCGVKKTFIFLALKFEKVLVGT